MHPERQKLIRSLFDEYIEMYASRDDRLTTRFSENFSGYAGSSAALVKDRSEWVKITRQDFAQVPNRLGIEMINLSMQEIGDNCAIVTAFFHIHLPLPDKFLSHETARLVLVFQAEGEEWKIVHSGISIPYRQADEGEIYPLKSLQERNRELEEIVEERTQALKHANAELAAISNTDGLTDIANRRYFDYMLNKEWNRAKRADTPISLLIIDVDRFKHYNDQYGHIAGDTCLKTLAKVLTNSARRGGDLAARFGGEEFVVLLPNANVQEALEVARRIQHEIWSLSLPHIDISPSIVTVSIGVASLVPSEHNTPENLLKQADLGLYRAKASGRNAVRLATD
jgi:diguanylate cyclase (GGDEF)-like protein